jgi:hypothetical protein
MNRLPRPKEAEIDRTWSGRTAWLMTGEGIPRPVGSTTHRRRNPTTIDMGSRSGRVGDHRTNLAPTQGHTDLGTRRPATNKDGPI